MWSGFRSVLTNPWLDNTTDKSSGPRSAGGGDIRRRGQKSTRRVRQVIRHFTGGLYRPRLSGHLVELSEKPYRELRFKLHQNDQAALHRILVEIHQSRFIALIAELVERIRVLLVGVAVDKLIVKFRIWVWHKASHCETEKNEMQARRF